MSINVENIDGSMIAQHYIEDIADPDHLRLVSHSDLFTPTGRQETPLFATSIERHALTHE